MAVAKLHYKRPDKIRGYKKQLAFLDAPTRFTIVEATTKAGKTVGCIVWLAEQAMAPLPNFIIGTDMVVDRRGNLIVKDPARKVLEKDGYNYWWVAPTYKVAKIAFRRFKRFLPKDYYTANESELTITLINGAMIYFKSGQDSDTLYGEDVHACVIDEATRISEDSWFAVFSTLTATEGLCKIIGNVKGTNNWAYKLAREAETGKKANWSYHKITADDAVKAGVIKQAVIDEARSTLPNGIFLELYYGIPFVNSSNKFAFAFSKPKHVKKCSINFDHPIYLSFDFNKNPICCGIYQLIDGVVTVPMIIKLENSDIYRLCAEIKNRLTRPGQQYNPDLFIVNGDAAGNAMNAMVPDNLNYFRIIKAELDLSIGQMKYLATNPRITENQVLVNAVLEHMPVFVDPDQAQPLIFDLEFAEMLPDGTLKKGDRKDPTQQLDSLDTFRYFINRNLRDFLKGYRNQVP